MSKRQKKKKKKHVSASIKDGDSMEPSSREKNPWKGKRKDGAGWGGGMGVGRLERRGSAPDSGPWTSKLNNVTSAGQSLRPILINLYQGIVKDHWES